MFWSSIESLSTTPFSLWALVSARRRQEAKTRWRDIAKKRRNFHGNTLNANFRKNFQRYQSFLKDDEAREDMEHEVKSRLVYINQRSVILFKNMIE